MSSYWLVINCVITGLDHKKCQSEALYLHSFREADFAPHHDSMISVIIRLKFHNKFTSATLDQWPKCLLKAIRCRNETMLDYDSDMMATERGLLRQGRQMYIALAFQRSISFQCDVTRRTHSFLLLGNAMQILMTISLQFQIIKQLTAEVTRLST